MLTQDLQMLKILANPHKSVGSKSKHFRSFDGNHFSGFHEKNSDG